MPSSPPTAMSATTHLGGRRLTDFMNVDLSVAGVAGGGFGLVYMGPDRINGNHWFALKTLRPDLLVCAPRLRELFVREAITWVSLWPHANLLTATMATEIEGQPFLILDYAKSGSLRDLLRLSQPFATRLAWAQHVAAGLVAIHTPDPAMLRDQPLVHRDLKPENVLIGEYGFARITDFGLAKAVEAAAAEDPGVLAALVAIEQQEAMRLATAASGGKDQRARLAAVASRSRRYQTRRGAALGTLAYMPPEQWTDASSVETPADIYAFGLILSELLAGRHGLLDLEVGADEHAWREAHERGKPRPLRAGQAEGATRLPQEVEDLYQAMLAKRSEDRPRAQECLVVLQRAAVALGEEPYEVPDVFPRTDEYVFRRSEDVAIAFDIFGFLDEALIWAKRALAVPGASAEGHITCGTVMRKLAWQAERDGQAAEAERWAERALSAFMAAEADLPDTHKGHFLAAAERANLLNQRGRHAEAEASYVAVLAASPDFADGWFNRADNERRWAGYEARAGHSEAARAHLQAALSYVTQATRLNPNDLDFSRLQVELRELLAHLGK